MMISVNDGTGNYVVMETGGNHNDTGGTGQYASPNGPATATNDPEWTDIWYLPGAPAPTGGDMTPDQAAQLAQIWGALFNQVPSQSPFRALGEGAIWEQHQFALNDDGMLHPQYVAWRASVGDPNALGQLTALASANPATYPDRAQDIILAQQVLAVVSPGPVVTPTPAPTPVPAAANGLSPTSLANDLKAAVTVLGGAAAVGTWVLHSFANVMSPGETTILSSAVVLFTGLVSKLLTVEKSLETQQSS